MCLVEDCYWSCGSISMTFIHSSYLFFMQSTFELAMCTESLRWIQKDHSLDVQEKMIRLLWFVWDADIQAGDEISCTELN